MSIDPEILDGFRLGPVLGWGPSGATYRGEDPSGRTVAVKVLTPGEGARGRDAIGRSVAALRRVGHPGLVPVEAVVPAGREAVALVSPLLSGPSLAVSIRRAAGRGIPVEEALGLGVALAGVLGALHRAGLVHGGLKPTNIFSCREEGVPRGGRPAVTDAGLVGWVAATSGWGPALAGAIEYLAPEVVRSEPLGPESDVYALGVILWELLAGCHPYRRATSRQTLLAAARGDFPPLTAAAPGVPPWLARVIGQAMARRPADRPSHGAELLALLGGGSGGTGRVPSGLRAAAGAKLPGGLVPEAGAEGPEEKEPPPCPAARPSWTVLQLVWLAVIVVLAGLAAVALLAGLGGPLGSHLPLTQSL